MPSLGEGQDSRRVLGPPGRVCVPAPGSMANEVGLYPAECSEDNPCEGLSRHATFSNFGMAFLTLFRVSTGDNWNGIMKVSA